MGEFVCRVADSSGRVLTRYETATSATEARRRLGDKGFYVYSVRPRSLARLFEQVGEERLKRLKANDFLLFNQQLLTLIRAGLPILQALDLLAKRSNKPALAAVLEEVRKQVRSGASLSEAMQETGVFPAVYTTAVLAGERSGDLVGVLEHYIAYQKITGSVRRRLATVLVYPALLVVVATGVLGFVISFVVPRFASLYSEMNAELPALTRAVITFALEIRSSLLLVFTLALAAGVGLLLLRRTPTGARLLDQTWMELPLVGEVVQRFRLAQFGRTLSTLIRGGIPLVSALETAGGAMESPVLRRAIMVSADRVREGQPLHAALGETRIVPELVTEMIEVGEATGALSSMLESVAEFYDEELNARVATLMALVEPLLLLVVGGVVLVILVALYLPIFSVGAVIR